MPLPTPAWSVYRRVDDGLDYVATVLAWTEGEAAKLATRLPDAPRFPIICRAIRVPGRVAVVTAEDLPAAAPKQARHSRRRAA